MINIAVCHNGKTMTRHLQELINCYSGFDGPVRINTYFSGSELLTDINEGIRPDIVFMDNLPDGKKAGDDIAAALRTACPRVIIIYLLPCREHRREHTDNINNTDNADNIIFLNKPLTRDSVDSVLDRAMSCIAAAARKYYYFTYGGIQRRIDLNEVLYIESSYKIVRAKMKDSFSVRISGRTGKSFSEVCGELEAEYPVFCQPKKGLIVNALHIDNINQTSLRVADREFMISPDYRQECLKRGIEAIISFRYYRNA